MQKPETRFRQRADKDLKTLSNSWWESIQQKSIVGSPDKLGVINGHFIALEFKDEKGVLSPMQDHKLQLIAKAGGTGIVTRPSIWKQTLELLKHLANTSNICPYCQGVTNAKIYPSGH